MTPVCGSKDKTLQIAGSSGGSSDGLSGGSSGRLSGGSSKEPSTVTQTSTNYTYNVTPADLAKEQQAFQPGEEVRNSYTHTHTAIIIFQ